MAFNDNNELKRLRRQLHELIAERDKLLDENRRLRRDYSIGSQSARRAIPPPTSIKLPLGGKETTSAIVINNESPLSEKV